MQGLIADLLRIAFHDDVPERIRQIWPGPLADRHALSFKACPILPIGHDAPARAYVSNGFEPGTAFVGRIQRAWPDPRVGSFFGQLGPAVRKIIDTDGTQADLFLDDLHVQDHSLAVPDGADLLAATLRLPDARRTRFTRHGAPPRDLLDDAWNARLDAVLDAGLAGHWAIRWDAVGVTSLLLVNESRWSGDPEASAKRLDALADPRWLACRERAPADGLAVYPDAIEVTEQGWDVTVGLFDPRNPSSRAER